MNKFYMDIEPEGSIKKYEVHLEKEKGKYLPLNYHAA